MSESRKPRWPSETSRHQTWSARARSYTRAFGANAEESGGNTPMLLIHLTACCHSSVIITLADNRKRQRRQGGDSMHFKEQKQEYNNNLHVLEPNRGPVPTRASRACRVCASSDSERAIVMARPSAFTQRDKTGAQAWNTIDFEKHAMAAPVVARREGRCAADFPNLPRVIWWL